MTRGALVVAGLLAVLVVCAPTSSATESEPLSLAVTGVDVAPLGATVRWRTRPGAVVRVTYGLDEPVVWSRAVASGPAGAGRSPLTSLEPGHRYRYRVVARSGRHVATATGELTTPAWPDWVAATTTPRALVVSGQPFFPRMVWKQCPWAFSFSLAAGINVFMGVGCDDVHAHLARLRGRALTLTSVDDRRSFLGVAGYHHLDEADVIVDRAEDIPLLPSSRETKRPTFLTLSNHFYSGADPLWKGRSIYRPLVARAEMVGFNLYPLQIWCRPGALVDVYRAQRELVALARGKPTYQWIEAGTMSVCTGLNPSPATVRAETWLAIAGGARGIGWFPDFWSDEIRAEIGKLSREIASLAPALLAPEVAASVVPASSPVRAGARRLHGATYVVAVNSALKPAQARIRVRGLQDGTVLRVLGENRTVTVRGGVVRDWFRGLRARVYVAAPRGY